MAGARIEVSFDDSEIREVIERLQGLTKDFRPLLKRIGVGLVETTQHRFLEAKDPMGNPWQALNPLYADQGAHAEAKRGIRNAKSRAKRSGSPAGAEADPSLAWGFKRGPGILRGAAMRGGLMGSLTFKLEGGSAVAIGSNKVYAAIHQFGGVIRPKNKPALRFWLGGRLVLAKSVTIPARPYLGMGAADREMVLEQARFTMAELLRPA